MKKILSLILAATFMIFSSSALAEDEVSAAAPLSEKYNLLINLGIIEEGSLSKPSDELVSRAEAAMVMCSLLKIPVSDYIGDKNFRDVMPGSVEEDAIYAAVSQNLISPVKDNYFYPSYPITRDEMAEAICMSLGYAELVKIQGAVAIASDNKLYRDVKSAGNLTRADFYAMLRNALFMPVMSISGVTADGQSYTVDKSRDLLYTQYDIDVAEGIITMAGGVELDVKNANSNTERIKIGGVMYKADKPLSVKDYLGRKVKCYYYYNDDFNSIAYIEMLENNVMSISGIDAEYNNMTYITRDENGKETKHKLDNPYVIYNNTSYSGAYSESVFEPANGSVMLVDNDGDENYEIVFIYNYADYLVKMANEELGFISDYYTEGIKFADDAEINVYEANGSVLAFSNITDKTVISVMQNTDNVDIYVSNKQIEGSVSEIYDEGAEMWKINDTYYRLSDYLTGAITSGDILDVKMYKNYVFYFNMFDEIVYFGEKTGFIKNTNYGILTRASEYNTMATEPNQLRIFSKYSGGFENYTVAEKVILNDYSGCDYEDVYTMLKYDGVPEGISDFRNQKLPAPASDAIIPQLIEFGLNENGEVNVLKQVGNSTASDDTLKKFMGAYNVSVRSLAYRDTLTVDDPDGNFTTDGKPSKMIGYNTTVTESLQVPYYSDGTIAVGREDLFAVKAIPRANWTRGTVYVRDKKNLMADFMVMYTDADAKAYCGNELSAKLIGNIQQVIRDDEAVWELTTSGGKYYLDSKYDANAIPIFNKSGVEVKDSEGNTLTHKLRRGDIVNLLADDNNTVTAIEIIYSYEDDKLNEYLLDAGQTNYLQSRNGMYNLSFMNMVTYKNGYVLMSADGPDKFDMDTSPQTITSTPSSVYFYDEDKKEVRKATSADYIGMFDTDTEYVRFVLIKRYEQVTGGYIIPQCK